METVSHPPHCLLASSGALLYLEPCNPISKVSLVRLPSLHGGVSGPCADGYGVCCLQFTTSCQTNVKQNVSYIQVGEEAQEHYHQDHFHRHLLSNSSSHPYPSRSPTRTPATPLATAPQSTRATTSYRSVTTRYVRYVQVNCIVVQ